MADSDEHERFTFLLAEIGESVRRYRKGSNKSLRALAEECGISHEVLWRIEHGKTNPRLRTLFVISEALDCPLWNFMESQRTRPDPLRANADIAVRVSEELLLLLDKANSEIIGRWLLLALQNSEVVESLRESLRSSLIEAAVQADAARRSSQ